MSNAVRVLIVFVVLMACIVFAYVGIAAYKFYQYYRLTDKAAIESISWSVKPETDERFRLQGAYEYTVDGKKYHGTTLLQDTPYRNSWAAEQAIKETQPNYKTVWYDYSDPSVSNLEKNFPTKDIVYAAILFAILNYFVWGGYFYTQNWLKTHGLEKNDRSKK